MAVRLGFVLLLLALLPSCSWWSGISYPIPPTTDGADETPIAFEHYVQVSWSSTDLSLLESLEIQFPSDVAIVPSASPSGGDELSVEIHYDVEKANDAAYSQAYLRQIESASSLNSQNAKVHVPLPEHPCQQTVNAEGQISAIQGVCVRQLVVSVPASHPVPISVASGGDFSASGLSLPSLQLTLADGTHSDIEKLDGDLTVSGGGPTATLVVKELGPNAPQTGGARDGDRVGNLTLLLDSIQSATLGQIAGSISISFTHPPTQAGAVTLDGTPITTFPFTRP